MYWDMEFEWSEKKNRTNVALHGISFEKAKFIFSGFCVRYEDHRKDYGEKRQLSIGPMEEIAVIVVVHTQRHDRIRIISARSANRKERRRYHEALQKRTDD